MKKFYAANNSWFLTKHIKMDQSSKDNCTACKTNTWHAVNKHYSNFVCNYFMQMIVLHMHSNQRKCIEKTNNVVIWNQDVPGALSLTISYVTPLELGLDYLVHRSMIIASKMHHSICFFFLFMDLFVVLGNFSWLFIQLINMIPTSSIHTKICEHILPINISWWGELWEIVINVYYGQYNWSQECIVFLSIWGMFNMSIEWMVYIMYNSLI